MTVFAVFLCVNITMRDITVAVIGHDEPTIAVILSSARGLCTIDIADHEGTTPVLYSITEACQLGAGALHSVPGAITQTLVQHLCDLDVQLEVSGDTPLIVAARAANTGTTCPMHFICYFQRFFIFDALCFVINSDFRPFSDIICDKEVLEINYNLFSELAELQF